MANGHIMNEFSVTNYSLVTCFCVLGANMFIGDTVYQYLEFRGPNSLYWLHFYPVYGFSGFQYGLLVTPFTSIWSFEVSIHLIGGTIYQY